MNRLQWSGLLLVLVLAVLWRPPALRAQSPAPPQMQTAGIPGMVTLAPGGSVTFAAAGQRLLVEFQLLYGPATAPLVNVSYDGTYLRIEAQLRFVQINLQPADEGRCIFVNDRANTRRCAIAATPGSDSVAFTANGGTASYPCPDVTLAAGWNLISGGLARSINTNNGPLYTLDPESGQYVALSNPADAAETGGYWVLFDAPTPVFFFDVSRYGGCGGPPGRQPVGPVTIDLPAGQWLQIGNPFPAASVAGADLVLSYDAAPGASHGYHAVQMLGLGEGAWAYSAAGGTLTLAPTLPIASPGGQ